MIEGGLGRVNTLACAQRPGLDEIFKFMHEIFSFKLCNHPEEKRSPALSYANNIPKGFDNLELPHEI